MLKLFGTFFTLTLIIARISFGAEIGPYSKDGFEKIQKSGGKIVLQYHASWCPVCKKQRNALNTLVKDSKFHDINFIAADYDTEQALKKKYGVKGQSTVILFSGEKEVSRVQGMTDEIELSQFIQKLSGGK